jgi:hypothetical protein
MVILSIILSRHYIVAMKLGHPALQTLMQLKWNGFDEDKNILGDMIEPRLGAMGSLKLDNVVFFSVVNKNK